MQKTIHTIFVSSLICLVFSDCGNKSTSQTPDNWGGNYHYEEQPVEAIAGYKMVMEWDLFISKQKDTCQGILEINGQQTFIKLKADIRGDSSEVAIIYNEIIDGDKEQLKKGDTLFRLKRISGRLKTGWFTLQPRLADNPAKECNCFEKGKSNR